MFYPYHTYIYRLNTFYAQMDEKNNYFLQHGRLCQDRDAVSSAVFDYTRGHNDYVNNACGRRFSTITNTRKYRFVLHL